MSTFDPASFLDTPMNEANSIASIPIPEGEYTAIAEEPVPRPWTSQKDDSSGVALDIVWNLDDAGLRETLGRQKVTAKQSLFLDILENGHLDMGKGKNVGLGRLREAVGLNTAGKPFNFRMIAGQVAKVKVANSPGRDGAIFSNVVAVAKM